ncbi:MAG: minor capsid protein [Anaerovoracaceae bacterium]|nr:minor capsid protein [Anaerovoracaceae bacterium]
MEKIINKRWVNGENFSDRVWKNTDKVANYMQNDFKNAVIRGDAYERCTKELTRRFGVSYTAARRLIYTEGTFVMNEASMTAFEEFYDEYIYMAHLDERTSKICRSLNGQKFKISEREAGVNFPPMHANCRSTYNIVMLENWDEILTGNRGREKPIDGERRTIASKIAKKFSKDSLRNLSRKELEHYATDIYARKQIDISYEEGVRRAKSLMIGNTDAQLKKYVLKYQSELKSNPGNGTIKSAKDIIHLTRWWDL